MNSGSPFLKWSFVVVPVLAALAALWPPSERLKGGIDLVGGTSLLYEIDTTGLSTSDIRGLAVRVMNILKKRVDPNGQLNLIWRPIGNNRIEIQMPRPSLETSRRRDTKDHALALINGLNVGRNDLEVALNSSSEVRAARLAEFIRAVAGAELEALLADVPDEPPGTRAAVSDALSGGVPDRAAKLERCKTAFDALRDARDGDDEVARRAALDSYDAAVADLLTTNVDLARVESVLSLQKKDARATEIDKLRAAQAAYAPLIDFAVESYDRWVSKKGVLEDPSDLKRRIRGAGVLEFRILATRDASNPLNTSAKQTHLQQPISRFVQQLEERGPRRRPGDNFGWFPIGNVVSYMNLDAIEDFEQTQANTQIIVQQYAGEYFVLMHADPDFGLLKSTERRWKLSRADATRDSQTGFPAVSFGLDARGGTMFAELTGNNINRPLGILLDGTAQSYANIVSRIRTSGQISGGGFTQQDVVELVRTLEAGSLPARLGDTPLMEKNIGPSLGKQNRTRGMNAALGGLIAVAVFILIYYRVAGVLANIALFMNLLFVLGIMALMQATFTLPGIAALILTVGMAVDANVLIFERIREERQRGTPLRKAIRVGYEKAFSTIVDANITTLITCIILGYVGSEEVKGFAMVLGFGICTSMFTSLFVTRLIMTTLQEKGWITDLKMFQLVGKPTVDWISLRRIFWPVSLVTVVGGMALFSVVSVWDPEALYDIEFLGGTAVQIELQPGQTIGDDEVRLRVSSDQLADGGTTAVGWLRQAADDLSNSVRVTPDGQHAFRVESDMLNAEQIGALVKGTMGGILERDGITGTANSARFAVKPEASVDEAKFKELLQTAAVRLRGAAQNLAGARVQTVEDLDDESDAGPAFEITTVETDRQIVQTAIVAAMGDSLLIERPINFRLVTDDRLAPDGYFPIEDDDRYLEDALEGVVTDAHYDIQKYKGGVVLVFDALNPPQTEQQIARRIREIRLQPEFEDFKWRDYLIKGLTEADDTVPGASSDAGGRRFTRVAMVVVDENVPYSENPEQWEESLAKPELLQAEQALRSEKTLRKVIQFAPQIAGQTRNQAVMAMVLALGAIVAYVWVRFGTMQYGLAAIVAVVHDVGITLGLLTISHYVFDLGPASMLGIIDFKIDLPMVAALLTIVGYSLNDTIVIFDRIRENRGKSGTVSAKIINASINQTLSRTVLTSLTTFMAVLIMYVFGGAGVHGFAFALCVGVIVGTYSSLGVAAPLLYRPRVLHVIVYVMLALGAFGVLAMLSTDIMFLCVAGGLIGLLFLAVMRTAIGNDRGRELAPA